MEKYFKRTVYIRLLIVGIIDVAGRQNLYIMKTLENEYIGEAALIILNGICLRSYPIYIYPSIYSWIHNSLGSIWCNVNLKFKSKNTVARHHFNTWHFTFIYWLIPLFVFETSIISIIYIWFFQQISSLLLSKMTFFDLI